MEPVERRVIYLGAAKQAVFFERAMTEQAESEAVLILRAKIREGLGSKKSLSLGLHSDSLVVKYVE